MATIKIEKIKAINITFSEAEARYLTKILGASYDCELYHLYIKLLDHGFGEGDEVDLEDEEDFEDEDAGDEVA